LLDHGVLYLAFAALPFDFPVNYGFVFAYTYGPSGFTVAGARATPGTSLASATFGGAGVWQAGYGLVADPAGNVYFQTGQLCKMGVCDPQDTASARPNLGNAIVKLKGGTLEFLAAYISPDSDLLNAEDLDLGSSGPLLLPKGSGFRLLGGGKQGIMTLHELNDLSHPIQRFRGTFKDTRHRSAELLSPHSWNPGILGVSSPARLFRLGQHHISIENDWLSIRVG
jgi:hypothetical protein